MSGYNAEWKATVEDGMGLAWSLLNMVGVEAQIRKDLAMGEVA